MKVLVTGSGYLGAHIAESFRARGDAVRLLTLDLPEDMAEWAGRLEEVVLGDVTDPDAVARACAGRDAVVHTAALNAQASDANDRAAVVVNGWGTANVVERAAEAGVGSFVYLSTFHVYGPPQTDVIDEGTPCFPVASYASTHLLGESFVYRAAARGRLAGTVLRLANGYGAPLFASADCWMLAVNDFARSAVLDGAIVLKSHGTQRRDFVAVSDVARAVGHFVDRPAGAFPSVVCVGSGESSSVRELADTVADVWRELSGIEVPVRVEAEGEPGPSPEFAYSIELARSLGFEPSADRRAAIAELLRFVEERMAG